MELEEALMSEEAFEELIRNIELVEHMTLCGRKAIKQNVEKMQRQITKQEKMIELMLEEMTDCEFEMNCSNCNCECERDYDQLYSCNREYFENKAEESE